MDRHSLVGLLELAEKKRQFQFNFLIQMGLKPNHYFLDIGCGTLRGGIPVIRFLDKKHYAGVDVRSNVLEEGRKDLAESKLEHKEPDLVHCQNLATLDLSRKFDFVWAYQVFIHISDELLNGVIAAVARHLSNSGVFYVTVNVGVQPMDGIWRTFAFYQAAFHLNGLKVIDMGSLSKFNHSSRSDRNSDSQRMLKVMKV